MDHPLSLFFLTLLMIAANFFSQIKASDHFPGSKNGFDKIKNLKEGFFDPASKIKRPKRASDHENQWAQQKIRAKLVQEVQNLLIVSKEDRSGHYSAVQQAIDAVPMWNSVTKIIYIKPGTYYGTVLVPKHKQHIRFVGNGAESTVLSYDRKANQMKTDGTEYGILDCASIIVEGSYFSAKGITFENASPKPAYLDFSAQAPAIRISGDYCAFYSCNFVGWQDTLFADQGHHYYKDCRIEGSVDYILGYAAAVFETCTIRSKGEGFITAQSRWCNSDCAGADSYFAFLSCNLIGTGPSYLGRPWRPFARVFFINSFMGAHIVPEGWNDWLTNSGPLFPHDNVYFGEYGSTGPGSSPQHRISWSHQIYAQEASQYINWRSNFKDNSWLQPFQQGFINEVDP